VGAFVSMPFEKIFDPVFEVVSKVLMLRGIEAMRSERVDEQTAPWLLPAVDIAIRDSRFIIADLTGSRPHVLREVHYASRLGKPCMLMSQERSEKAMLFFPVAPIFHYHLQDLTRLHSFLSTQAADVLSAEAHGFAEAPMRGPLSAMIGLRDIVPGQWKNPFSC
jgi:hypothetical protein